MYEIEHSVFEALKEVFATAPRGCYPISRRTFEEAKGGGKIV